MGLFTRLFGGGRHRQAVAECLAAFPFAVEAAPGAAALARMAELRSPDFIPILLGDAEDLLAHHALLAKDPYTMRDLLGRVQSIGMPEWWLTARAHALEDRFAEVLGAWPEEPAPLDTVQALYDADTGEPRAEVFIARLPLARSADAPALLRFGGWNGSPFPEEHVAIARAWREEFGAEIIAVTARTLEFTVARPPATRDAADALALTHFAYCPDIVNTGVGTLSNLAARLLNAPNWCFRWE
ncbi:MAG TPA: DUF4253 domain-containing protein [Armatimonadota bacterium]|nr:DUF4253 domain-containing protein [Armatimonadota bacterium]